MRLLSKRRRHAVTQFATTLNCTRRIAATARRLRRSGLPPVTRNPHPTPGPSQPVSCDIYSSRSRTRDPTSAHPNVIPSSPAPITAGPNISRPWRDGSRFHPNYRRSFGHVHLSGARICCRARRGSSGFGCRCRHRRRLLFAASQRTQSQCQYTNVNAYLHI
jgi:hypothetical protein